MHNGILQTTKAIPFLASRPRVRTKEIVLLFLLPSVKAILVLFDGIASCSVPFAFVLCSLARASLQLYVHVSRPRAMLALQDQYCNKEHYTQCSPALFPPADSDESIVFVWRTLAALGMTAKAQ
ncbi:hypothetical protein F5146DRAFT_96824 [Armillaria mellea]|nr:hypothetical protein F5146DRAFT_96824 [Armillaria mellea]